MVACGEAGTADGALLLRLQETLSANKALLTDESVHVALRRCACGELLQCLEASLLQEGTDVDGDELLHRSALLDTYRQTGSIILAHGHLISDSELLYTLLRILQQTARRHPLHRTLLLEWLPRAMLVCDPDGRLSGQVLRVLKEVLQSDPASAKAIVHAFTCLPLSEEERDQVVEILLPILDSTKTICEPGAECLIRTLLSFVDGFADEQAEVFWLALRRRAVPQSATTAHADDSGTSGYHQSLTRIVLMVLTNFHSTESGLWLALSYKKHIKDPNAANTRFCTLLDVLLLLLLGEELPSAHADAVDLILDRWLADECLPVVELVQYFQFLVQSGRAHPTTDATVSIRVRLLQPLLQLALFLVLAPIRHEMAAPDSSDENIDGVIVAIYKLLDQRRQLEFVQSLLNLCSPNLLLNAAVEPKSAVAIHNNVIALLEAVTEAATRDHFGAIKSLIIEQFLSPSLGTAFFSRDHQTIIILASLLCQVFEQSPSNQEDNPEIMTFVQNLLLTPSLRSAGGGVTIDNPLVVRGIILATELVRISATATKVAPLKDLVLKHLLPNTRFTVDPATGLAGLGFLQVWVEKFPSFKAQVFQAIKMILANTGLIQRPNEDPKKLQQVAYARVPQYINQISPEQAQIKPMLFCVAYFMRRVTLDTPSQWKNTITWIFDLLDMYLTFGQKMAPKTWKLEGWLMAGIEFPANLLPVDCYEGLDCLLRFDTDSLFADLNDVDYALILEKWRKGTGEAVLLEPFLRYQLSLWIAIGVSAALLKNAFHHYKSQPKSDNELDATMLRLIQLQLLKLFDLKWRLQFSASLIRELRSRESQESPSHRKTKNDRRSTDSICDENIPAETLTDLEMWFFDDEEFINSGVLWACLLSPSDEQLIISAFSDDSLDEASPDGLFITLKVHLLDHLASRTITDHSLEATTNSLMHCSRISNFLVNRLPSLRLSSSKNDTSMYSLAVSLSSSYLRVLCGLYITSNDIGLLNFSENTDTVPGLDKEIAIAFEWLKITDNEDIAACIIDLLSVLVTRRNNTDAVDKAIEMSWTALHTIYASNGLRPVGKHAALSMTCLYKKDYKWSDRHGKKLRRLLRESWLVKKTGKRSYMASHWRIIQHFGLLLYETKYFVRNFDHVTYLVADVDRCATQLRIQCGYEEEKKDSRVGSPQPYLPNLPFLANGTCSGIHEVTLYIIIWALATLEPVETLNGSPFQYFICLAGLFRQLIDIFCESYHAFPHTSHHSMLQAAHRALLAGISSSYRCVEWRHQLMSSPELADRTDHGSSCYLKAFFDATASDLFGRVLNLCDFFLAVEDRRSVTRVNKLRQTANESLSSLNILASMHNFPTPTYQISSACNLVAAGGTKKRPIRGFHEITDFHDADKSQSVPENMESSSEGSFGVAGDWDCSDSE